MPPSDKEPVSDEEAPWSDENDEPSSSPPPRTAATAATTATLAAAAKLKKKYSKEKLEKIKAGYEKRGIVYISRIPPHMKPNKVRSMLEPYGEIGRLYLAPEELSIRKHRKKTGNDSGKNFTEGWIEFLDKQQAKDVAKLLNGQPMGGKAKSRYKYDLWNIKYLKKFKWDHLTEEMNYLKAIREQRLAAEVEAAKKERDFYMEQVNKAKAIEAIQSRKKKKRDEQGEEDGGEGGKKRPRVVEEERAPPKLRVFGQRVAKLDPMRDADAPRISSKVLSMFK